MVQFFYFRRAIHGLSLLSLTRLAFGCGDFLAWLGASCIVDLGTAWLGASCILDLGIVAANVVAVGAHYCTAIVVTDRPAQR